MEDRVSLLPQNLNSTPNVSAFKANLISGSQKNSLKKLKPLLDSTNGKPPKAAANLNLKLL
jgi:hypothetical protein